MFIAIFFDYRVEQFAQSPTGGPGRIGDTSQKGNWSCFRNEIMNSSTPFSIGPKTVADEIPSRGILEFDFSSSRRPEQQNSAGNRRHSHHQSQRPQKLQAFRSNRLFAVLTNCKLMSYSDKPEALRYLHKCREDCNRIIKVTISLHIHIKTDYLTN